MSGAAPRKRAVNLSLTAGNVAAAKRLNINLSEVADRAIAAAVAQGRRDSRQERMDAEMEQYNIWSAQGVCVADEYGTL